MIWWRTYKLESQIFNMRLKKAAGSARSAVIGGARRTVNDGASPDTNA